MSQIGYIPEINAIKKLFKKLETDGFLQDWELPCEHILTRLNAAVFFLTPRTESSLDEIWEKLKKHDMFQYKKNENKALSPLAWRVTFNKGPEL